MITRDAPGEFARVISCTACTVNTSSKLLRDAGENVPQPGYIGQQYDKTRLVLSGQNPGVCPSRFARQDAEYTKALRDLQSDPTPQTMKTLTEVLGRFVPQWPIHGNYFPLAQCGLGLSDIAYFNVVRCRTLKNAAPGKGLVRNCLTHYEGWIELLQPRAVVFLGKWACHAASYVLQKRHIPFDFIDRERSLSADERQKNNERIVEFVRRAVNAHWNRTQA